jgi:hypothetical protein
VSEEISSVEEEATASRVLTLDGNTWGTNESLMIGEKAHDVLISAKNGSSLMVSLYT